MKTELKTLKDFRQDVNDENDFVLEQDLRKEAVKWVKKEKSIWINAEKFFNLTEEDLK